MNRRLFIKGGALTGAFAWMMARRHEKSLPDNFVTSYIKDPPFISSTQFLQGAKLGKYSDIHVNKQKAFALPHTGGQIHTILAPNANIAQELKDAKVKIWFVEEKDYIDAAIATGRCYLKKHGGQLALLAATVCSAKEIATLFPTHHILPKIHPEEKQATAYHEAGHALAGVLRPGIRIMHKVTIRPGIDYWGVTYFVPDVELRGESEQSLKNYLVMLMSGRAGEKQVRNGNYSDGATSDHEYAKHVAQLMVAELGMSKKIGPVKYGNIHTGLRGLWNRLFITNETLKEIEDEITVILKEAEREADILMTDNKERLVAIGEELLRRETLEGPEVRRLAGLDVGPPVPAVEKT